MALLKIRVELDQTLLRRFLSRLAFIDHTATGILAEEISRWVAGWGNNTLVHTCLFYTSDAADDLLCVDIGGRRRL